MILDFCFVFKISPFAVSFIIIFPTPTMWPKTKEKSIQYPEFKKQRKRPRKSRIQQSDEVQSNGTTKLRMNYVIIRCRNFGQVGYNMRSDKQLRSTT